MRCVMCANFNVSNIVCCFTDDGYDFKYIIVIALLKMNMICGLVALLLLLCSDFELLNSLVLLH